MPVAGLLEGAEALQSPVHAGGTYAKAHGREASQMHCEWAQGWGGHGGVRRAGKGPVPPGTLCLWVLPLFKKGFQNGVWEVRNGERTPTVEFWGMLEGNDLDLRVQRGGCEPQVLLRGDWGT